MTLGRDGFFVRDTTPLPLFDGRALDDVVAAFFDREAAFLATLGLAPLFVARLDFAAELRVVLVFLFAEAVFLTGAFFDLVDFLDAGLRTLFFVAVLRADFLAELFFAVDFFAAVFLAVDFFAVDFFAVDFLAVDFLAVDFFAVDFFAVDFLAVDFFAAFFVVALPAVFFFAAVFLVACFLAAGFLAPVCFFAATFLAAGFLAEVFFLVVRAADFFLADGFVAAAFTDRFDPADFPAAVLLLADPFFPAATLAPDAGFAFLDTPALRVFESLLLDAALLVAIINLPTNKRSTTHDLSTRLTATVNSSPSISNS